jgi:ketosteroid isomerase-like protein
MGIPKGPTEGGSGGKRGHSNMEHWMTTEEIKSATKKRRRLDSKQIVREELTRERNMGNLRPSLAAETQALREAYAALNRGDIPAFVKVFDPQIERIEEFPGGATCHGLEALEEHVSLHRGNWAEGSCEPQRFIVAGDKVIVFVDVRVRLKHEMQWREGQLADVYTFRSGKATAFRTFADRRQALEWAGAEDADAD